MPIAWRSSADTFAAILRSHGAEPDAVRDVETAWRAFGEFLQVEVDGVDPDPDADADGFILQWGRYSWHDERLSLSLTRHLAVTADDPEYPEFWQVELTMCFADEPDLIGLETLEIQDTDFAFEPIGPQRTAALDGARAETQRYPQLRAVWRATPVSSSLSFDNAC